MAEAFPKPFDQPREALLDAIEAYLRPFRCFLMVDQTDDACWRVVDSTSKRFVIAELRDLEAFALMNGIRVEA